jgi:hypothetical protein
MPTLENVVNQALDLVGYSDHVGNIYEGSKASVIALDTWGETRDEVLALQPWYFARSEALLTAASGTPPAPWLYQFAYPAASVRLLMLRPATVPLDPAPVRWHEYIDPTITATAAQRTILASFSPAYAVFTARVLDTSVWPADFTIAVIQMLAKKFEVELGRPLPQRPQRPPQQEAPPQ